MVVAAQDGVIMILAYQSRVFKKSALCAESATRCLRQLDIFCHIVKVTSGHCTRKDMTRYWESCTTTYAGNWDSRCSSLLRDFKACLNQFHVTRIDYGIHY